MMCKRKGEKREINRVERRQREKRIRERSQMSRMDQGVKDKFMVSVLGIAMKAVAGLEF